MIDVYLCGRYEFLKYAHNIGYKLGTRSTDLDTNQIYKAVDDGLSINFVDNDFKNPNYEELRDVVEILSPNYAVLPDYMGDITIDQICMWGSEMEDMGVTPIVVPKKTENIDTIPTDWIIGYSVPSGYGSTDIDIVEFVEYDVHLLGGSHKNQIEYANRAIKNNVSIVSVDGNAFFKAANFGNIVNTADIILSGGNNWEIDVGDRISDWSDRVKISIKRYYELWEMWSNNHNI